MASAFFGAISGSNPATVAAIGGIMIPAMISKGYPAPFSASIAAAGGTLGVVIPPSIPMITFGVVAGVSIGDLFIASILPGVFLAVLLSLVVVIRARKLNIPTEAGAVVFLVIATSQSFSWLVTVGRISEQMTQAMLSISQNPFVIVTLTNVLLLFLGIFLET